MAKDSHPKGIREQNSLGNPGLQQFQPLYLRSCMPHTNKHIWCLNLSELCCQRLQSSGLGRRVVRRVVPSKRRYILAQRHGVISQQHRTIKYLWFLLYDFANLHRFRIDCIGISWRLWDSLMGISRYNGSHH
jgi:hypothetical protein